MFDIFRKPLKVLRKAPGGYTGGYWQDGELGSFMINASVQGTNAEVLQTMPEGARTTACYTLRTDTKLLTATAEGNTPDIVILDNEKYLVMRVTAWQNLPSMKHYEIVVVRENTDAD